MTSPLEMPILPALAAENPLSHVVDHWHSIGGTPVISNHIIMMLVSATLMLLIFGRMGQRYLENRELVPGGRSNFFETIMLYLRDEVAKPTLASAIQIGNPVSLPKAVRALAMTDGIVEQASEEELANAAARADMTGMFNCPHTGVALACLEKLVDRKVIAPRDRVVVISTAHGLKFTEFKVRYHEAQPEQIKSSRANPAVLLPPDYDRVSEAIRQRFTQA